MNLPPITTMFAIAYDLDTALLSKNYPTASSNNAYADIRKFLEARGFKRQQGSVLYGDDTVTMVNAIIAISDMARHFSWLAPSIKDIRILQLLNNDDLMPAVLSGAATAPAPTSP
jgi:virulence-associated protein VapD